MQFTQATLILSYLAAFSIAAPLAAPAPEEVAAETAVLEARQNVGITSNEYDRYGCRPVIFFFARGSTELGNMVSSTSTYIAYTDTNQISRDKLLAHQLVKDSSVLSALQT
jgi:hypothetical protein